MIPLLMAEPGDKVIIQKVNGKEDLKRHLESLGFVLGAEVSVVSKMGSNLIVNVKESRIAVSKEMASKNHVLVITILA